MKNDLLTTDELREALGAPGSGDIHLHSNPAALLAGQSVGRRQAMTALVDAAEQRGGDMLASEDREFRAHKAVVDTIAVYEAELVNSPQAASARWYKNAGLSPAYVTRESRTYEPNGRFGYFHDLISAQVSGDLEARSRLEQHGREVRTDLEVRDLTRVDGAGGYFVPPAWLMDLYAPLARAGRPTANLVNNLPLPPGTDSINIPLVSTGTATAIQTADNSSVQETDLADATIAAGVKTIAGQQDVAIQAIEQSPIAFDEIIFADLMADLATKVDQQVLSGSNSSNQVKGIFSASGTNAVTYTDASPTVGELYAKIADAVQQIHTGRYMAPNVIVMHPRRWAWFLAALDSSNRPLVVPNAQGPYNAFATPGAPAAEGVVGSLMGLPVVTDPSIPTNIGAATNEDKIIVMRASDTLLWESPIKTRLLPDIGSGTLTLRLQIYSYIAMTAERYPKSISILSGTGLTNPF